MDVTYRRPISGMGPEDMCLDHLNLDEVHGLQDVLQDAAIRFALPASLEPLHRKLTVVLGTPRAQHDAPLPSLWERLRRLPRQPACKHRRHWLAALPLFRGIRRPRACPAEKDAIHVWEPGFPALPRKANRRVEPEPPLVVR